MSTYSKGPWRYNDAVAIIFDANLRRLAEPILPEGMSESEMDANGRLMASAPELEAKLREAEVLHDRAAVLLGDEVLARTRAEKRAETAERERDEARERLMKAASHRHYSASVYGEHHRGAFEKCDEPPCPKDRAALGMQ